MLFKSLEKAFNYHLTIIGLIRLLVVFLEMPNYYQFQVIYIYIRLFIEREGYMELFELPAPGHGSEENGWLYVVTFFPNNA